MRRLYKRANKSVSSDENQDDGKKRDWDTKNGSLRGHQDKESNHHKGSGENFVPHDPPSHLRAGAEAQEEGRQRPLS